MGLDLKRAVDIVRDDMKEAYKKDPSAIWKLPFIVVQMNGETVELPTDRIAGMNPAEGSAYMAGWLNQFRGPKRIEAVVVGRQVVKMSGVLDASGQPSVKQKGIMVSGRTFAPIRTIVSITPTKEFHDYRSEETIQAEGMLPNPALESPDTVKATTNEYGTPTGMMIGQFGEEERHDSQNGALCVADPIIEGMGIAEPVPEPSVSQATEPDMTIYNALKKLKIGKFEGGGNGNDA